ncbi:HET-domain-containing protein [Nemania sp. NC0429]|nr:HET-domain-containing protein [Nemania sp. NC0429]
MCRQLCADEGFSKGGWFAGPLYPLGAKYPPVERTVELFAVRRGASQWPTIKIARHVAAAADSPDCIELIRTWISECAMKHRSCKKLSTAPLPDRVVFVGAGAEPHLVESRGMSGKYIALSHRWGGQVSLQLKGNNLEEFKRSLSFSGIPITFQDAIEICRALAVDYIWIDSLCIIQDSKEDWDIAGSKMHEIYANSWLTIAADAAENSEAGFIHSSARGDLQARSRKLACLGPKGKRGEVFVRPWREFGTLGGFGRHYTAREQEGVEPSKRLTNQGSFLLRRGWVLQETLLPHRVIHFLPDEVTWRCATASRCECQPRPHGKVVHEPLDLERPREIDPDDLKEYWKEVVEQYTERQLTFPSDRLAALAGIASHAHLASPEAQYYAGLWSDTLPSTLLWTVERRVEYGQFWDYDSRRIKPCIAPTWSWASITGHVNFLFWKRNFGRGEWANSPPDMSVIAVNCVPIGQNKYGAVRDAKLTVEGYICNVRIQLVGGSKWHFPFKMQATKADGTMSSARGLLYPDTTELLASLESSRESGMAVTAVSVYESRMFLFLKQVEEDPLVFERIGVGNCHVYDDIVLSEWGQKKQFTVI